MKSLRKGIILITVFVLVLGSTVSSYAASGTVHYKYENNHVFMLGQDMKPAIVSSVGVTINAGADFSYGSSDTQSRTYNKEEWWLIASSINAPEVTNDITCSIGALKVYPINASAKTCTVTYHPSMWSDPNWISTQANGSKTSVKIMKSGGNSYGTFTYSVRVPKSISGGTNKTLKFNNLGTASGTVTVNSANSEIMGNEMITVVDNDKLTRAEIEEMSKSIKAHIENKEQQKIIIQQNKEYQALLKYAKQENLSVGDEEVEKYLEELFAIYEKADNMEEIKSACNMAGTTYEELIKNDFEGYRVLLTEEKVYNDFLKKYNMSRNLYINTLSYESYQAQVKADWKKFKENLVD